MRRTQRFVGLVAIVALVTTACTVSGDDTPSGQEGTTRTLPSAPDPSPNAIRALVRFDACESFLDYVISHGVDLVGAYGFGSGGYLPMAGRDMAVEEAAATDGGESAPSDVGGSGFSGTNVQVEGVDEPDMVKTDGDRIVVVSEGELIVVDVTGDEPVETGRLSVGSLSVQSLFLSGDEVLLFGSDWMQGPMPLVEGDMAFAPVEGSPTVRMVEVDISAEPRVVRTMTMDGSLVSGRMVGDAVRLVLTSGPVGFEWSYPSGSGLRAEREAIEKNREIVRNSTEENWIPYYVVTDAEGRVTDEGVLFDCSRATHPEDFSGLDMLSVVTIDLGRGLDVVDSMGVLATGDTLYASAESLYVATQNWQITRWMEAGGDTDMPDGPVTSIHKFDISDPRATTYVATGSVQGFLLNQFAMDEYEGMLRVASTSSPSWWGSGPDSESKVSVLRQIGDGLVEVGSVDGLGATEQIYSVRFMGDVAYVVTFRQTDPLYIIDLSDPRRPEMVGELKIPGYSAYLHPVGDGRILGVGQDATDEGQVQGTQVSLFDVSDPTDPQRLDTYTLSEGSNSSVEWDHHAFLYWDGLAVIPVQQYRWDEKSESAFFGAVGLKVSDDGLTELDKVVHPGGDDDKNWDWRAQIVRAVAVGDSVYTISAKGIMKSSIDDLASEAWLDF